MLGEFRGLYQRYDYGSSDWDYSDRIPEDDDCDDDYDRDDDDDYCEGECDGLMPEPFPRYEGHSARGESYYRRCHDPRQSVVYPAYDSPYYDDQGRSAIDPRLDPRDARRLGPKASEVAVAKRYEEELKRRQEESCVPTMIAKAYYAQPPKPPKCPVTQSATSLPPCDHRLKYATLFEGVQTFVVPEPRPVPIESSLASDPRYALIYATPEQLRQREYEYRLTQGREGNPYSPEAMNARQGLMQYLACDFAPRKSDPYARPVAKPMRGKTLAQAKVDMRLPRPSC